jgi:MHS family proline/betaine transporter-like MFS transporter
LIRKMMSPGSDANPINPDKLRKTIFAGAIGNAIEFYDFIIYAYLAVYFAYHFFPSHDPVAALIASYGAFATGMIMRPVGGLLLGRIGDRIGRKMALQVTVASIAIPTLIIGLLPTYETIGLWAPIVLILLRMLQGLAVGGEYTSSIVFLIEHAPPERRGFIGSFSPMGAFGGLLLGTAVCFVCLLLLGEKQMHEWGWRVPFILSVVMTIIGIYARRSLTESALNLTMRSKSPVKEVFREHWRPMISICFANTSTGIVSFIGFMYAVQWMVKEAGVSANLALLINLAGLTLVALMSLLGGYLGDRWDRVQVARLGVLILLVGAWPAFMLFQSGNTVLMLLGGLVLAIGQGFFVGPLSSAMTTLLPPQVRVTGISFAYSLAVGLFGGIAPMVTEYLLSRQNLLMAPAMVIMAGALISLLTLIMSTHWQAGNALLPEEKAELRGKGMLK